MKVRGITASLVCLFVALGCSDDKPGPLFPERPECSGDAIVPLMGQHAMVISTLNIGMQSDGFDLDGDGDADNKFAAIGSLANPVVDPTKADFGTVVGLEFFDYPQNAADDCVKFAMYITDYSLDRDMDDAFTADAGGDCNDWEPTIHRGAAEIMNDGIDNDCDGIADDGLDTSDADMDGVTIAQGDCDDTRNNVGNGGPEICGDGLDNDCDGVADFTDLGGGASACTPFDADTPDEVVMSPQSLDMNGNPIIKFPAATTSASMTGSGFDIEAGPSLFAIVVPVTADISLDFRITGATILGTLTDSPQGLRLEGGRLGGVLDANTLDKITGVNIPNISSSPDDTLLDLIFANLLGDLIALPQGAMGCTSPDIDVDQDGRESFCDSDPINPPLQVDTCIDGDGTIIMDTPDQKCTEARDSHGNLRFVDGISIALTFEAVPATLVAP